MDPTEINEENEMLKQFKSTLKDTVQSKPYNTTFGNKLYDNNTKNEEENGTFLYILLSDVMLFEDRL